MVGIVDLPKTKLAITSKLKTGTNPGEVIRKINEIIDKINFLDEHINFLYDRSRTQYNTLMSQAKGLQNVYDEFQEFKKRFSTFEQSVNFHDSLLVLSNFKKEKNEHLAIESSNSSQHPKGLCAGNVYD